MMADQAAVERYMGRTRDAEHVVCPYCGCQHGDAWEWCNGEQPTEGECDDCGKTFKCWAEYDVTYIAEQFPDPPPTTTEAR